MASCYLIMIKVNGQSTNYFQFHRPRKSTLTLTETRSDDESVFFIIIDDNY